MRTLIYSPQGGGVRHYRQTIPARALQRLGHDVTCLAVDDESLDIVNFLNTEIHKFDIAHVGYITLLELVELFVAARSGYGVHLAADLDDDIDHVPSYNIAYCAYHGGSPSRKVARLHLKVSDAVSVSTPPLVKMASGYTKFANVLPNCLDPIDWKDLPADPRRGEDRSVRIMFSGNLGRYGDITEVRGALEYIMGKYPQARLIFLGCYPDWAVKWASSPTDARANRAFYVGPCRLSTYFRALKWLSPDILVNPLVCNEFNTSKSHIKAYDAAMSGAVYMCTDWHTHDDVPTSVAVKVKTEYEWREGLCALIEDAGMRHKLNLKLHEWAHDCWHIDKHVHKWVDFYEGVRSRAPRDLDAEVLARSA